MATHTADLDLVQSKAEEAAQVSAADRAMGAAMIASGIGSLVLGLAIILSEVSAGIKTFLTWNSGVGSLSGKTGVSIIAFVVGWAVLHFVFKSRPISLMTSFIITVVLVALGLLLTFPPVFLMFGG
ncbi:MAG: hypothetical protein KME04_11730 [Pleurocapsa minor GSE-CHR-MK-17-07R]|jgi:hypothetical protein|nr:hypothetical protein [Pleurocapsa minor GSE-CHR-MK 17-07R]